MRDRASDDGSSVWEPKFLCGTMAAPIILSDGRVTTCTKDVTGRNTIANIFEDDFPTVLGRYAKIRMKTMANPIELAHCWDCFSNLDRWKNQGIPHAHWKNGSITEADKTQFIDAFDPSAAVLNIETSSKCNLRCIGCAIAAPNFRHQRTQRNIDMDHLMKWLDGHCQHIANVRLYHIGETFAHPRWAELSRFLKAQNPQINTFTSTNGMIMSRPGVVEELATAGLDSIMFSLHGARAASSRKYMGDNFDLEKALAAARKVASVVKEDGNKISLSWRYVLFEWNDSEAEIEHAIQLARDIGFTSLHFTLTHTNAPSRRFRIDGEAWRDLRARCRASWPTDEETEYQRVTPMIARLFTRPVQSKPQVAGQPKNAAALPSKLPQPIIAPNNAAALHAKIKRPGDNSYGERIRFATSLAKFGFLTEATDIFADLTQTEQATAAAHQAYGNVLREQGSDTEALAAYAIARERYDGDAPIALDLACAHAFRNLGRHSDAVSYYTAAIQKREAMGGQPYGEVVYYELAETLAAIGDGDRSQHYFRRWIENHYIADHINKIIYAWIPKNACTYLKTAMVRNSTQIEAFRAFEKDAHVFTRQPNSGFQLQRTECLHDPGYFTFAVLRDPFQRLVSAYANVFVKPLRTQLAAFDDIREATLAVYAHEGRPPDFARSITFEQFIRYVARTPNIDLNYHWRPQRTFFDDPFPSIDFVGRGEDMAEIEKVLAQRVNWRFDAVENTNRTTYATSSGGARFHSARPHDLAGADFPPADRLYTPELRELVIERYQSDFELYQHQFGIDLRDPPSGAKRAATPAVPRRTEPVTPKPRAQPVSIQKASGADVDPELQCRTVRIAANDTNALQQSLKDAFADQANGQSTRLVVAAGVYRPNFRSTTPNKTDAVVVIAAEVPGTVAICGSDPLRGWRKDGRIWSVDWPSTWDAGTPPDDYGDPHLKTPELMLRRELISVNDRLMRQVLNASELQPGCFFIDEEQKAIRLAPPDGLDPNTANVEVGMRAGGLILNNKANLILDGLEFRHDVSMHAAPQCAPLQMSNCRNVLIQHCLFRQNNNKGLYVGGKDNAAITIRSSRFVENGCIGLHVVQCRDLLIKNCETSQNNWRGAWSGFYRGWGCGFKVSYSRRVSIRRHRSFRNLATGGWIDLENTDVLVEDSQFYGNYRGLHLEAGGGPFMVSDCQIIGNRQEPAIDGWRWSFGSGLALTHVPNVTVTNCFLADNDTAQIGVRDDRETRTLPNEKGGGAHVWRSEGLCLIGNTVITTKASASLLHLPDGHFDAGRFWNAFTASGNRYYAACAPLPFQIGGYRPNASGGVSGVLVPRKINFDTWRRFSRQDEDSAFHEDLPP